ncbi:MAG: SDR family oxidoreductase [Actinobacteria bacterium]|nr:SDR family oxidoreductase [Actinomycetota bacterium]
MPERLAGKAALITGASSGIGAATARLFVEEGARVALLARRREPLEELAAELGEAAIALSADVAVPEEARAGVAAAIEQLGGLDVVVNSAGVAWPATLAEIDDDHWRQVIDINLSGSFYVCRAAGLHMKENGGGTIVNLGSEMSVRAAGMYIAYCASKAGILGLTRGLAAELAPDVTVNAICPGPVDTPMMTAELETFGDVEKSRAEAIDSVPLKRFASAEEVAVGILYLAAEAPFATGTTLELDGGTTAV